MAAWMTLDELEKTVKKLERVIAIKASEMREAQNLQIAETLNVPLQYVNNWCRKGDKFRKKVSH